MFPLLVTLVGSFEFKIAVPPVKESSKSDVMVPEPEFSVKTGSLNVTSTVLSSENMCLMLLLDINLNSE